MANKWTCKCGATTVTKSGGKATATGKGWVKGTHGTHIVCHECNDSIQIGYEIVWENREQVAAIRTKLESKASSKKKGNGKPDVEFVDELPGEEF